MPELGPFTRQNMFQLCPGENIRAVSLHAGPRADGVKCHMVKCHVLLGVFCYCVLGNVRKTHWLVSHYWSAFLPSKKTNTLSAVSFTFTPLCHCDKYYNILILFDLAHASQYREFASDKYNYCYVATIWDRNVVIVRKIESKVWWLIYIYLTLLNITAKQLWSRICVLPLVPKPSYGLLWGLLLISAKQSKSLASIV